MSKWFFNNFAFMNPKIIVNNNFKSVNHTKLSWSIAYYIVLFIHIHDNYTELWAVGLMECFTFLILSDE